MIATKPQFPTMSLMTDKASGIHPNPSGEYLRAIPKFYNTNIWVKTEDPNCMPNRAHLTDAGADLVCTENVTIYPGDKKLLDTGVAIQVPVGYVGLVFNRSSQGKIEVQLANAVGVIDSDYRGNIKVLLKNNGENPYVVKEFDTRIAQLVIVPIVLAIFKEYTGSDWDNTERGAGGFGSTG